MTLIPIAYSFKRPAWLIIVQTIILALVLGFVSLPFLGTGTAKATNTCQLSNGVKHVIYVQFDNVHFTRDNPNIPSDLEQMPNLLNFIEHNGVMLANQHTPLIAHTENDILTSLTGIYGDSHGMPVSNSYRYFNPDGTSNPGLSFAYWTDPLYDPGTTKPTDTTYNMLAANGKNAPAPWVPYTRAGCNVGSVSSANTVLENSGTDIPTVFGANSAQAQEVKRNPKQATADFVGIGIHCAKEITLCSVAHGGTPDYLPNESGGYHGYQALFGHKYVAPQISSNGPLTDLDGNVIRDENGNAGFPGFDNMSASVSLSYVAAMQEHGVPVTYAYISDAHDNHTVGTAYGPGSAGYVATLKSYNKAFGKFFTRLTNDGITSKNTLFVFTADEGDHFVGSSPSPAKCDGVNVPCSYNQIGEVNVNLTGLLATQQNITTPFQVHADSAPTFYITGNPARDNQKVTRPFERALGKLTVVNPLTGQRDTLSNYLADPVEMSLLHMVTADPARTPTLTMFAKPDYYSDTGAANCSASCVQEVPTFAWNHGDVSSDINVTWLGMVGPGVKHLGATTSIWSDHTDTRPTMMELLGLRDDYLHDGRVLVEILRPEALPETVRRNLGELMLLAQTYKQINAPLGALSMSTLQISTTALKSSSPNDSTYTLLENQLLNMTRVRKVITGQMISLLESAEFGDGHGVLHTDDQMKSANELISQAQSLLDKAQKLAQYR